jgi:uncharacterized protein YndB with AHSA1/START domain
LTAIERLIDAPPQAVWDVLADGWLYPLWVVGATRMRAVDDDWPAAGTRLHHSIGVWPMVIDDTTEVVTAHPVQRLELRAKGWPIGEADVVLELEAVGTATRVTITEDAAEGPGRLLPGPFRMPLLKWRNVETLRRLSYLVEGRARGA